RGRGRDRGDARMGVGRAHEGHMRHARQRHVADELRAAAGEAREIRPRHRAADIGIRPEVAFSRFFSHLGFSSFAKGKRWGRRCAPCFCNDLGLKGDRPALGQAGRGIGVLENARGPLARKTTRIFMNTPSATPPSSPEGPPTFLERSQPWLDMAISRPEPTHADKVVLMAISRGFNGKYYEATGGELFGWRGWKYLKAATG